MRFHLLLGAISILADVRADTKKIECGAIEPVKKGLNFTWAEIVKQCKGTSLLASKLSPDWKGKPPTLKVNPKTSPKEFDELFGQVEEIRDLQIVIRNSTLPQISFPKLKSVVCTVKSETSAIQIAGSHKLTSISLPEFDPKHCGCSRILYVANNGMLPKESIKKLKKQFPGRKSHIVEWKEHNKATAKVIPKNKATSQSSRMIKMDCGNIPQWREKHDELSYMSVVAKECKGVKRLVAKASEWDDGYGRFEIQRLSQDEFNQLFENVEEIRDIYLVSRFSQFLEKAAFLNLKHVICSASVDLKFGMVFERNKHLTTISMPQLQSFNCSSQIQVFDNEMLSHSTIQELKRKFPDSPIQNYTMCASIDEGYSIHDLVLECKESIVLAANVRRWRNGYGVLDISTLKQLEFEDLFGSKKELHNLKIVARSSSLENIKFEYDLRVKCSTSNHASFEIIGNQLLREIDLLVSDYYECVPNVTVMDNPLLSKESIEALKKNFPGGTIQSYTESTNAVPTSTATTNTHPATINTSVTTTRHTTATSSVKNSPTMTNDREASGPLTTTGSTTTTTPEETSNPATTTSPATPSIPRTTARPAMTTGPSTPSIPRTTARPVTTTSPATPSLPRTTARPAMTTGPSMPSIPRTTARPVTTTSPATAGTTTTIRPTTTTRPAKTPSPTTPSITVTTTPPTTASSITTTVSNPSTNVSHTWQPAPDEETTVMSSDVTDTTVDSSEAPEVPDPNGSDEKPVSNYAESLDIKDEVFNSLPVIDPSLGLAIVMNIVIV